MSHFTQVKVELRNKEILISTLKRMYPGRLFSNGEVRGFRSLTKPAELVLRGGDTEYFDIGFNMKPDGVEILADWWGAKKSFGEEKDFLSKLKVEYARTNVQVQSKKLGYFYSEKTDEKTGQIQISLSKFTS